MFHNIYTLLTIYFQHWLMLSILWRYLKSCVCDDDTWWKSCYNNALVLVSCKYLHTCNVTCKKMLSLGERMCKTRVAPLHIIKEAVVVWKLHLMLICTSKVLLQQKQVASLRNINFIKCYSYVIYSCSLWFLSH